MFVSLFRLADKGHTIVGVEGSAHAITGFFKDQGLEFIKEECTAVSGHLYKVNCPGNFIVLCLAI